MGEIDDEIELKRYIYFLNENQHYVVQKKENIFSNKVNCVINLLAAEKINRVIEIIEEANKFEWLPNRNVLFHILVLCTRTSDKADVKSAAYNCAARLIKTAEDLFQFIKYERALQTNASSGLRRVIKLWYLNQDTDKLYDAIINIRSIHGWTHRDALRIAHIKAKEEDKSVLFAYACRGLVHAQKQAGEKSKELLEKLESVENWRRCNDEKKALELIESKVTRNDHIPGGLLKSATIWAALVPQMPLNQLINELGRFHRLGMFKTGQPALNSVVEALGDAAKCRSSGLLPATVLQSMKQFERPRPMDPKLKEHLASLAKTKGEENKEDKEATSIAGEKQAYSRSHAVTAALGRLLHHSLRNVRSLPPARRPKLCLLTVEIRGDGPRGLLRPCFGCPTVRYGEASALLVLLIQRLVSTQHVMLACFNGAEIIPVQLESSTGGKTSAITLAQVLQRLRETGTQCKPGAVPTRPLRWAIDNRKQIDAFINVLVTGDGAGRVPKLERHKDDHGPIGDLLQKYRQRAKLPNTRMLNIALCGRSLQQLQQTSACAGVLNIVGFNPTVPSLLNSFFAAPIL